MESKIWIITGTSKGIGLHLLEEAAKKGYIVIGTVRKEEDLNKINNIIPGKTFGYLLDVNNHERVKKVVDEIYNKFKRIDVLVNNAGYGLFGAVEEVNMVEARQQMETNVFGALAVTQAVLPYFRKQKSGHVIQISSIAGISSTQGLGIYNASKYALEGFSEALYKEVSPLGIHVTIVEPGPFRTEWAGASMKYAKKTIEDYQSTSGEIKKLLEQRNGNQPGDPIKAALAIIQAVETKNPPLRLALGKWAVEGIENKIKLLEKDLNEWRKVSIDTAFD